MDRMGFGTTDRRFFHPVHPGILSFLPSWLGHNALASAGSGPAPPTALRCLRSRPLLVDRTDLGQHESRGADKVAIYFSAGRQALPHFQQKTPPPAGHSFYETGKAKAKKKR